MDRAAIPILVRAVRVMNSSSITLKKKKKKLKEKSSLTQMSKKSEDTPSVVKGWGILSLMSSTLSLKSKKTLTERLVLLTS